MAAGTRGRSVAGMITKHRALLALGGAAIITALSLSPLSDEWFFVIALIGPLLTGLAVGLRAGDLPVAAAAWFLAGLVMLATDWIAYGEDRIFHLGLATVMAGLVALGALAGRGLRRIPRVVSG